MSLYVPANTDSVLRLCFGFGAALSVLHLTSVYPVNLNSLRHVAQVCRSSTEMNLSSLLCNVTVRNTAKQH